jgi:hypothetical protein
METSKIDKNIPLFFAGTADIETFKRQLFGGKQ